VVPAEVEPGEAVTLTIEVANTGGMEGDYSLVLEVNGEYEESVDVTIAAGETASVSFTLSKEQPGTYTVSVNGITAGYEVTEPAPAPETEPTPAPTPPPAEAKSPPLPPSSTTPAPPTPAPPATNWWLIGGIIAGVILVSAIAWRLKIFLRRG